MIVIILNRDSFDTTQFNDVTKIEYDKSTKVYTLLYGENNDSIQFSSNDWLINILFN